ncbi:MAG: Abi family protein [Alphaproteobacteria bacterium]|nr:Abi family protein [Alphaproteobacteria bacterium]
MTKRPYLKPATTYAEQIRKLRERGMLIADEEAAKIYLQHINYYRLGAYWLPFESDHAGHRFREGARFEDVVNLYVFDRELRLLLLDAIERVEVSARAQWAYRLGHMHGAHAHLDSRLSVRHFHWQKNLDDLRKEVERADEVFIQHLTATYAEDLPPVWAVCEVMSLGLLSRWYANLKPMHTRSLIANVYGLNESVFASWLHHLSVVRNVCAHHSRLWDRDFSRVPPEAPISKPKPLVGEFVSAHKLYNTLTILLHLMDCVSPNHHWRGKLKALLINHVEWLKEMGFPDDWQTRPIWQ